MPNERFDKEGYNSLIENGRKILEGFGFTIAEQIAVFGLPADAASDEGTLLRALDKIQSLDVQKRCESLSSIEMYLSDLVVHEPAARRQWFEQVFAPLGTASALTLMTSGDAFQLERVKFFLIRESGAQHWQRSKKIA